MRLMDSLESYLDRQPGQANPMMLKEGEVVGAWRIRALIGRGGSSEVYRVEHVQGGGFAALKFLLPAENAASDERRRLRFQQESRILSSETFVGFPRFHGTGTWQGRPYFVEELLEPCDLPQTDRGCARFLQAICRGIAELHKRGIVHRDLKPSNILFRKNGEPVIVDLGLAKCPTATGVETDASLENGKPIGVGTPGYAAPEQFIGGGISPSADIHALGVLAERIVSQQEWRGGPLAASSWRRIIRRATSSIPSERYQSVAEFAAAIRRRHWPFCLVVFGTILGIALVGTLVPVGRDHPIHRNPDKMQSARTGVVESLDEVISLRGATKAYDHPIRLASNRTYRITGPGTLDADISGPSNSLVVLKNCVLINRTHDGFPKNGVRYRLEDGVYLNFINQKERLGQSRGFLLPYDGACNEVRFGGPTTLKGLNRSRAEKGIDLLRKENDAVTDRYDQKTQP